jgi:beta-mannosidase
VGNGNAQSRVFSKGIWKSVNLVAAAPVALTALKVLTFYTGAYPSQPLTDATAAPFTVQVTAYFYAPAASAGVLTLSGAWGGAGASNTLRLALPEGDSSAVLNLTASGVALWWANEMGQQPLYAVSALFTPDSAAPAPPPAPLAAQRSVGFRVAHLVTVNDTDPAAYAGSEGSGNFTMRFKLNGADVYARGGNMIPLEEMEGRRSSQAYSALVSSAAAAHFNVFRVWGGGIYLDDAFFDACDALGIMLYEDVMFGSDGRLAPVGNDLELAELQYQVRRLAHHPSVFLWSACNECGGGGACLRWGGGPLGAIPTFARFDPPHPRAPSHVLPPRVPNRPPPGTYESFVSPTIAAEDPSRVIWPSCPSLGWATGVSTLTGLPTGGPLKIITRASAAAPCPGAPACTQVVDQDYDKGFVGQVVQAATAAACCAECQAAGSAACFAATFWQGSCYFKPAGKAFTYSTDGAVSVFPPGSTPPPPAAAACPDAESHGPYTHGFSAQFPAVNGQNDVVNLNLPPALAPPDATNKGTGACGAFTSEFGASVFSSFESMAPTLPPRNWALWGGEAPAVCTGSPWGRPCVGGNPMAQRNYPGDSFNLAFFGPQDFNTSGVAQLRKSLYFNMAAQALEKKGDIEVRRSKNHWGSITWQLNEIWPTGGWGSLEYGTVGFTPGQVLGGRWKPLHHLMEQHLYRDTIAVCGADGSCFTRNDNALAPFAGTLTVSLLALASGAERVVSSTPLALPRGGGAFQYSCFAGGASGSGAALAGACPPLATALASAGCAANGTDCAAIVRVADAGGALVDYNFQLLAAPYLLALPASTVSAALAPGVPPRAGDGARAVALSADATALYVTLTTLAQGRFEENFMHVVAGTRTVWFIPFAGFDEGELAASLRVEHVGMYL